MEAIIPVGTDEWWEMAFPVIGAFCIDGWQFEVHVFNSACAAPKFSTIDLFLRASLVKCSQSEPRIRIYQPCGRCRQFVGLGSVKCTTPNGRSFAFSYRQSCKCNNGGGVNKLGLSITGFEAAGILYSYFSQESSKGGPNELVKALIAWRDDVEVDEKMKAIERFLAIIRSFGIDLVPS